MVRKLFDAICKGCDKTQTCEMPCPPVSWLRSGEKGQRESIRRRKVEVEADYNRQLAELATDREERDANRIEAIRNIPDFRRRIVLAALLADIPQDDAARCLKLSQGQISRISRGE